MTTRFEDEADSVEDITEESSVEQSNSDKSPSDERKQFADDTIEQVDEDEEPAKVTEEESAKDTEEESDREAVREAVHGLEAEELEEKATEENTSLPIPKKQNKTDTGFEQYTIPQLLGLIQAYNQKKTCNIEKYYKPLNKGTLIAKIKEFMELTEEEGNKGDNIIIKSQKPGSMTFNFAAVEVDTPRTRKAKKAAKKATRKVVSKSTQQELKRIKKSYTEYKRTLSPSTDTEADNLFKAHQERVAKHREKLRERTAAAAPAPRSPTQSPKASSPSPKASSPSPKASSPKATAPKTVRRRTTPAPSARILRSATRRPQRSGSKKTRKDSSRH